MTVSNEYLAMVLTFVFVAGFGLERYKMCVLRKRTRDNSTCKETLTLSKRTLFSLVV